MYKSLTIYLYQNNYYEDLILELYEIENKKKSIFRKVNTMLELKNVDRSQKEELLDLMNRELMILNDLMQANTTTAEEIGFVPNYISNDEDELE